MGVVHGLESDTGVITIEVAVLNEIFDGIDDLELSELKYGCVRRGKLPF